MVGDGKQSMATLTFYLPQCWKQFESITGDTRPFCMSKLATAAEEYVP